MLYQGFRNAGRLSRHANGFCVAISNMFFALKTRVNSPRSLLRAFVISAWRAAIMQAVSAPD
jgi:hypothetical protein